MTELEKENIASEKQKSQFEVLAEMVSRELISADDAAKMLNISEEEFWRMYMS